VILEYVARMAYQTLTLKADADGVEPGAAGPAYFRKHGPGRVTGRGEGGCGLGRFPQGLKPY